MHPERSIAVMKALADQSRLAIVKSLLERPHYVEELSERHALAASTISFHLRKLEQAGLISSRREQYYVIVEVNQGMFDTTLRQVISDTPVSSELQEQRMDDYHRKVLQGFFRNGRLEKLPAQHKKRLIVLQQFAARFEPGRRYGEQEVTELIAPLFDDYCTIRRLLVDERLILREGSTYWTDRQSATFAPFTGRHSDTTRKKTDGMEKTTRKQIKDACKQNAPEMGIFQILNKVNGKMYVAASRNLAGERNSRLFQLRMGKIVFNRDLQRDLETLGAKNFEFNVLETLDGDAHRDDMEGALSKLELHWLEKLQPFDDRGYNSRKAFERDRERLRARHGIREDSPGD